MQTVTKKFSVESLFPKATTAKKTDIAFVPVSDTLAAVHVKHETMHAHAEIDTRRVAIRAIVGTGFTMPVAVGL
jgi:hypothetical protein